MALLTNKPALSHEGPNQNATRGKDPEAGARGGMASTHHGAGRGKDKRALMTSLGGLQFLLESSHTCTGF